MQVSDYFYPRSPCGERPVHFMRSWRTTIFLSTLSLRRATKSPANSGPCIRYFYPRSPCGERHIDRRLANFVSLFLSTLSLRRATPCCGWFEVINYFYPRSPCGERHAPSHSFCLHNRISIHALLAESDNLRVVDGSKSSIISIHALLAESDRVAN